MVRRLSKRRARQRSGLIACVLASLAVATSGCVIVEALQAGEDAQDPAPNESRFERARQGEGSGFVPEVTGDCDTDLAAFEEVREIRQEQGLDGPEQVALQQLVEAAADCPDGAG